MIENTNIIEVNESDFNEKIISASENKLVIVDFWAPWCGPCKQLTPILEKVVSKYQKKMLLAKINIDQNQQVAAQLKIQSIPTVFAFKDKQIVNAFQGVITEKQIVEFIEKALGDKLEEVKERSGEGVVVLGQFEMKAGRMLDDEGVWVFYEFPPDKYMPKGEAFLGEE